MVADMIFHRHSSSCSVLLSGRDGQIYITGAFFRPHPNCNHIDTSTNLNTNTKPKPNLTLLTLRLNFTLTLVLTILTVTIHRGRKTAWSKSN